jgi:hypothetical protein
VIGREVGSVQSTRTQQIAKRKVATLRETIYNHSAFMVNPLYDPHILIFDETFLFSPLITEDGETKIEEICCVRCWLDLNKIVELIELWRSPEIGIAYCPLCNEETPIQSTFAELQKQVKQKLAQEEWRVMKYGKHKLLKTVNNTTQTKPQAN